MTSPPTPLQSALLRTVPGVRHGFFTRHGGVSEGIYGSLNVGLGSGDRVRHVLENRRLAARAFGARAEALATCFQVHSATVRVATAPWGLERPDGDGVVTGRPGVFCGALAADCAPVLIADSRARVVAAVHAGWRGALAGVVEAAVRAMISLGASPAEMGAAVGPCIGPRSYEVGLDFVTNFEGVDPGYARYFSPGVSAGKRQFDLPAFILARLGAAGVGSREWIGRDTCAEDDAFFSNRRAFKLGQSDYGRLLSVIMLDQQAF